MHSDAERRGNPSFKPQLLAACSTMRHDSEPILQQLRTFESVRIVSRILSLVPRRRVQFRWNMSEILMLRFNWKLTELFTYSSSGSN